MDERMMLPGQYPEGPLLCQTYTAVVHFNLRVFFGPFRINIYVWAGFVEFALLAVVKIVLKGRGTEIR